MKSGDAVMAVADSAFTTDLEVGAAGDRNQVVVHVDAQTLPAEADGGQPALDLGWAITVLHPAATRSDSQPLIGISPSVRPSSRQVVVVFVVVVATTAADSAVAIVLVVVIVLVVIVLVEVAGVVLSLLDEQASRER
jgi:hypothetical protein